MLLEACSNYRLLLDEGVVVVCCCAMISSEMKVQRRNQHKQDWNRLIRETADKLKRDRAHCSNLTKTEPLAICYVTSVQEK